MSNTNQLKQIQSLKVHYPDGTQSDKVPLSSTAKNIFLAEGSLNTVDDMITGVTNRATVSEIKAMFEANRK